MKDNIEFCQFRANCCREFALAEPKLAAEFLGHAEQYESIAEELSDFRAGLIAISLGSVK